MRDCGCRAPAGQGGRSASEAEVVSQGERRLMAKGAPHLVKVEAVDLHPAEFGNVREVVVAAPAPRNRAHATHVQRGVHGALPDALISHWWSRVHPSPGPSTRAPKSGLYHPSPTNIKTCPAAPAPPRPRPLLCTWSTPQPRQGVRAPRIPSPPFAHLSVLMMTCLNTQDTGPSGRAFWTYMKPPLQLKTLPPSGMHMICAHAPPANTRRATASTTCLCTARPTMDPAPAS